MHTEACIYVGAIRYHDAVGHGPPPPPPWVAVSVQDEDENGRANVASEDLGTYAKLKALLPNQRELGITRIVDV
jgi:hypothetical protein